MSSSGIETIVQCLAKAVESARGLDSTQALNLRFILGIANTEAGRVARAMRKPSTQQKSASTGTKSAKASTKTPAKPSAKLASKTVRGTAISAKLASKTARGTAISAKQQQSKSRGTSRSLNSPLAH